MPNDRMDPSALDASFRTYLRGLRDLVLECPCGGTVPTILDHGTEAGDLARVFSGYCADCGQLVTSRRAAPRSPGPPRLS